MRCSSILIVTPYGALSNNGNWRTAARWARLLRDRFGMIVQVAPEPQALAQADCMIALHARRSHAQIAAWRARDPDAPLVVVLTGTDLYKDSPDHPEVRDSISCADRLIVLQEDALRYLPRVMASKARVVYQSSARLLPARKPTSRLNAVMVGHLRPEKDPRTAVLAWRQLPSALPIRLKLIGAALDPALASQIAADAVHDDRVRLLGPMAHGPTRQAIKRAHVLLVPSIVEGGAHVVVEAVRSGTPVLASRVSGNIGMLGREYAGYFPAGDSSALAALLRRCYEDSSFVRMLLRQCRARAALFSPVREKATLTRVLRELL